MNYDGTEVTIDGLNRLGWDIPTLKCDNNTFTMDTMGSALQGKWQSLGDNKYSFTATDDSEEDSLIGTLVADKNKQTLTITYSGDPAFTIIFER